MNKINLEQKFKAFTTKASLLRLAQSETTLDFIYINNNYILDVVRISKFKLMYTLFISKLFGSVIRETTELELRKALSSKNKSLSTSLWKRFPDEKMRIIKIQKYDKANSLLKYKLYILIENEGAYIGLETTIL